jgi:hypothetical protein
MLDFNKFNSLNLINFFVAKTDNRAITTTNNHWVCLKAVAVGSGSRQRQQAVAAGSWKKDLPESGGPGSVWIKKMEGESGSRQRQSISVNGN